MSELKNFNIEQKAVSLSNSEIVQGNNEYRAGGVIKENLSHAIDCLYLKGELDAHTAPRLETALSQLISQGRNKIVVNFKELDYISSAGLGVFMAFIEDVRASGGDIKLADMKPKVYSVFDLLGFPILFDILNDDQSAIDKFIKVENK